MKRGEINNDAAELRVALLLRVGSHAVSLDRKFAFVWHEVLAVSPDECDQHLLRNLNDCDARREQLLSCIIMLSAGIYDRSI